MSARAYIPTELTFDGRPLEDAIVLTLFDVGTPAPHGSVTVGKPPAAGARGTLAMKGRHIKDVWRVIIPAIEITNRTAVGFEFRIHPPADGSPAVQAECLEKHEGEKPAHKDGVEEKFAIR